MKRISVLLGIFVVVALLAPAPSQAAIITFTANLTGPQETPPNASPATGFAMVDLNATAHTLLVNESFSGLTGGPAAAAHIHCCAGPGVAAIVAVPFPGFPAATSGTFSTTFDLTLAATYNAAFVTANGGSAASAEAALEGAMASGLTYVNFHNATFPGGEIRGQLAAVTPEPATVALFVTGIAGLLIARKKARLGREWSTVAASPSDGTMLIESDYRGHRIEVTAQHVDGAWDAEVRIRRTFTEDKPHVERVTCRKPTATVADNGA